MSTSTGAGASFGTQSPPLEATGQEKPMGVSSVSGEKPEAVPDAQQRQQYFPEDVETGKQSADQVGSGVPSEGKTKED
ncbi:uncharacterized protein LAESUDRAFT_683256 [Laetiporus sulphureus 93-53]|uniref:Uncharacterized protein n=1 Tax=Laetiporus sulphureus 93-53 TaxID=1314785 RepID=A0A165CY98_9APHY|nr:uncharacterized protein LAESUDRAFT_683256 [Laetiporus sulphureus 93-53]KZT03732.1 hypothetical protein LAESUDRAFT_683256 [Laetiporus sulphureus 93-53]